MLTAPVMIDALTQQNFDQKSNPTRNAICFFNPDQRVKKTDLRCCAPSWTPCTWWESRSLPSDTETTTLSLTVEGESASLAVSWYDH